MRSLWSATAAAGPELAQLAERVTSQVAVIGAGYTGLSTALHLAQAGRDVIVLEAADVGQCASGLNGGQVIPGLKGDPDELQRSYGERAQALITSVGSAADLVFELIREHAIQCEAIRGGWLQPASSEDALEAIARRVRQWQRHGAPVELLSRAAMAQLLGSERYCGGWIDRRGGTVQPLAYVRGLAGAALRAGARIFAHSPAVTLERQGTGWRITTPRGSLESPWVVLATNAYTDRLIDDLRRSIVIVPSLQVATAPIPESLRATILPGGHAASDTQRLLRYFRRDASGRLILGTRGSFGATPETFAAVHRRAIGEIYPQLSAVPCEYFWGGWVAVTADGLPHLHEVAPGLIAGLGYNGRGVAMATLMGRWLARWVLDGSAANLPFPVTPVRPIRLHRFSQIAARVAIQYYRALDALTSARRRPAAAGKP